SPPSLMERTSAPGDEDEVHDPDQEQHDDARDQVGRARRSRGAPAVAVELPPRPRADPPLHAAEQLGRDRARRRSERAPEQLAPVALIAPAPLAPVLLVEHGLRVLVELDGRRALPGARQGVRADRRLFGGLVKLPLRVTFAHLPLLTFSPI